VNEVELFALESATREELIEEVRFWDRKAGEEHAKVLAFEEALRWRPVSDPPTPRKKVQAWVTGMGDALTGRTWTTSEFEPLAVECWMAEDGSWFDTEESCARLVTHWRPLPKGPT